MASSRRRSWADQRFAGTALTAGSIKLTDLLENAPTSDTLTVVRIIGDLTVQYLVSTTVGDSLSIVDVGIGVVAASAFGVAGAVPTPVSETEIPPRGWLYVSSQPVSQTLDGAGGVSIVNERARFQFDIRAMRKIDKGILYIAIEQNNITIGGAMQMTGRVRSLCLT